MLLLLLLFFANVVVVVVVVFAGMVVVVVAFADVVVVVVVVVFAFGVKRSGSVFDIRREIHNLSILTFSSSPPSRATPAQGLYEQAKVNRLIRTLVSTLLTFFKFPKSSARFRCMTSFALCNPVSPSRAIVTSQSDTSASNARVNTSVNVTPK